MKKRVSAWLLVLAMLLQLLPVSVFAAEVEPLASTRSGTCGDDLTWELDFETGMLTISGTGAMEYSILPPWYEIRDSILSVSLPQGLTTIGESAFEDCNNLTSVQIPEGVVTIEHSAFKSCAELSSVALPESLDTIGYSAFYSCGKLASISLPEGLSVIDDHTFYDCKTLTSVTLPAGLTTIGDHAFSSCDRLRQVNFSEGLTSIGEHAFSDCNMTSIVFPKSLKSIGANAFWRCSRLSHVTFPDGLTAIGEGAFSACDDLTNIVLPDSIIQLGTNALSYVDYLFFDGTQNKWNTVVGKDSAISSSCKVFFYTKKSGTCGENAEWNFDADTMRLTISGTGAMSDYDNHTVDNSQKTPWNDLSGAVYSVIVGDGITSIGNQAFKCFSAMKDVTIPQGLTAIGDYAFDSCQKLNSIILPEGLATIGYRAFACCDSLGSITLPEGLRTISEGAFAACYNMYSITIPKSVTTIGDSAFSVCDKLRLVNYSGTEADWEKITIGSKNESLLNADIRTLCEDAEESVSYFCNSDGTHIVSAVCSQCGFTREEKTEDCRDEDKNGACDICSGSVMTNTLVLLADTKRAVQETTDTYRYTCDVLNYADGASAEPAELVLSQTVYEAIEDTTDPVLCWAYVSEGVVMDIAVADGTVDSASMGAEIYILAEGLYCNQNTKFLLRENKGTDEAPDYTYSYYESYKTLPETVKLSNVQYLLEDQPMFVAVLFADVAADSCAEHSGALTATVSPVTLTMQVGEVESLIVAVVDENGTLVIPPVAWSSSNTEAAVVSGGTVTAVSPGTAIITVTCTPECGCEAVTATAWVTVTAPSVQSAMVLLPDTLTEEMFGDKAGQYTCDLYVCGEGVMADVVVSEEIYLQMRGNSEPVLCIGTLSNGELTEVNSMAEQTLDSAVIGPEQSTLNIDGSLVRYNEETQFILRAWDDGTESYDYADFKDYRSIPSEIAVSNVQYLYTADQQYIAAVFAEAEELPEEPLRGAYLYADAMNLVLSDDGSASTYITSNVPSTGRIRYQWSVAQGSGAVILANDSFARRVKFTANTAGEFTVTCVLTDTLTDKSVLTAITITVSDPDNPISDVTFYDSDKQTVLHAAEYNFVNKDFITYEPDASYAPEGMTFSYWAYADGRPACLWAYEGMEKNLYAVWEDADDEYRNFVFCEDVDNIKVIAYKDGDTFDYFPVNEEGSICIWWWHDNNGEMMMPGEIVSDTSPTKYVAAGYLDGNCRVFRLHDGDQEYVTPAPVTGETMQLVSGIPYEVWDVEGSAVTGLAVGSETGSVVALDKTTGYFADYAKDEAVQLYVKRTTVPENSVVYYGYSGTATGTNAEGKSWFYLSNADKTPDSSAFTCVGYELVGWSEIPGGNPYDPAQGEIAYGRGEVVSDWTKCLFAVYEEQELTVTVECQDLTIKVGGGAYLKPSVTFIPGLPFDVKVTYKYWSADTKIATVDTEGFIDAINPGATSVGVEVLCYRNGELIASAQNVAVITVYEPLYCGGTEAEPGSDMIMVNLIRDWVRLGGGELVKQVDYLKITSCSSGTLYTTKEQTERVTREDRFYSYVSESGILDQNLLQMTFVPDPDVSGPQLVPVGYTAYDKNDKELFTGVIAYSVDTTFPVPKEGISFAGDPAWLLKEKVKISTQKKGIGIMLNQLDASKGTLYLHAEFDPETGALISGTKLEDGTELYFDAKNGENLVSDLTLVPNADYRGWFSLSYVPLDQDGEGTESGYFDNISFAVEMAKVSTSKARTIPGGRVEVDVTIEDNTGFAGFCFTHEFNQTTMKLVDVVPGALLSSETGNLTYGESRVTWVDSENTVGSGVLYTLVFEIAEDAVEGGWLIRTYLSDDATDFVDAQENTVPVHFGLGMVEVDIPVSGDASGDGKLTVLDGVVLAKYLVGTRELDAVALAAADLNGDGAVTAADALILARRLVGLPDVEPAAMSMSVMSMDNGGRTTLETAKVAADPGQTVTIPVTLKNNTGVGAFALEIRYDPAVLQLQKIAKGDALSDAGGSFTKNEAAGLVVWSNVDGFFADGELLELTFSVLETAPGGETEITVAQKDDNNLNYVNKNVQPVLLELVSGGVMVSGEETPEEPEVPEEPETPEQPGTPGKPVQQPAAKPEQPKQEETAAKLPFGDVNQRDWFYDEVQYVYENGIMNGVGGGQFDPNGSLTRAMVVQVLYNLEGKPESGRSSFADVQSGDWYHDAVTWAAEQQIVNGYGAGKFGPNDPVTREQFATILFRYRIYKGMTAVTMIEHLDGFADGGQVSGFAVSAMNWAVDQGIITGKSGSRLDAGGTATRAEAAAMLMRLLQAE